MGSEGKGVRDARQTSPLSLAKAPRPQLGPGAREEREQGVCYTECLGPHHICGGNGKQGVCYTRF